MGWATRFIEALQRGETVSFRPRGPSMSGKIESGQLCTVEPVRLEDLTKGDIVLCRVRSNEYLHLVKAVGVEGALIGNNHGKINGWTRAVFGKLVRIDP